MPLLRLSSYGQSASYLAFGRFTKVSKAHFTICFFWFLRGFFKLVGYNDKKIVSPVWKSIGRSWEVWPYIHYVPFAHSYLFVLLRGIVGAERMSVWASKLARSTSVLGLSHNLICAPASCCIQSLLDPGRSGFFLFFADFFLISCEIYDAAQGFLPLEHLGLWALCLWDLLLPWVIKEFSRLQFMW